MVIYERVEDMAWFPVPEMGLEIAAAAHAEEYPDRGGISLEHALTLCEELGIRPISRAESIKFHTEFRDKAKFFFKTFKDHGNTHVWMTGTIGFFSRKKTKSGKKKRHIVKEAYEKRDGNWRPVEFTIPKSLGMKIGYVEYPHYQFVHSEDRIRLLVDNYAKNMIAHKMGNSYPINGKIEGEHSDFHNNTFCVDRRGFGSAAASHTSYHPQLGYTEHLMLCVDGLLVVRPLTKQTTVNIQKSTPSPRAGLFGSILRNLYKQPVSRRTYL